MFPVPARGAGITVARADQGDAHVVRNTRRVPGGIVKGRGLRPTDVSGLDFPVFIDPQLDAALEISPSRRSVGVAWTLIATKKNNNNASIERAPIV